jgi:peroxiredoxin
VIADRLIGKAIPDVELPATISDTVNIAANKGWSVVFVYPYTGRTGIADPPNWDHIKGAHGSTPQALAFSEIYPDFSKLNIKVFGLSLCTAEWQNEFAQRNNLPFPLLSDVSGKFSSALGLDRFQTGGRDFLTRVSLIIKDAKIAHAYFPDPHADASICLNWLKAKL